MSGDLPNPGLNLPEQARRNRALRDGWTRFAHHRRQVMQLLFGIGSQAGGVAAVLGAGNCNDLDLRLLIATFREIHLVDWDGDALRAGTALQGVADDARIFLHPEKELTGIAPTLECWASDRKHPPTTAAISAAIEAAARAALPLPAGSCDVAASVCLLSQLLEPISVALSATHPQFLPLLAAVRLRHLQILFELLRPGGTALLVTDLVSSDTAPALWELPPEQLGAFTARSIAAQNFFTGLNPAVLLHTLQAEGSFREGLETIATHGPWFWDPGPRRYVVYGISFRRK